jgi:hypothetical protein
MRGTRERSPQLQAGNGSRGTEEGALPSDLEIAPETAIRAFLRFLRFLQQQKATKAVQRVSDGQTRFALFAERRESRIRALLWQAPLSFETESLDWFLPGGTRRRIDSKDHADRHRKRQPDGRRGP